MVLARLGRHGEAIRTVAGVRSGGLRAKAEFQQARSVLALGDRSAAIGLLRKMLAGPETTDSATLSNAASSHLARSKINRSSSFTATTRASTIASSAPARSATICGSLAVKHPSKSSRDRTETIASIHREIRAYQNTPETTHPQLLFYCLGQEPFIVIPWYDSTLSSKVNKKATPTCEEIRSWMAALLIQLKSLHEAGWFTEM